MKVILLKDIPNLGRQDEIKEVALGYARNFLFPKKLAKLATEKELQELALRKQKKAKEEARLITEANKKVEILEKIIITIKTKVQKNGKLFGSISAQEIAKNIFDLTNQKIEENNILLKSPIKKIGEYYVKVKVYKDITANIRVKIVGQ